MTNDEFIRYAKGHIRQYLPPGFENARIDVSTVVRPNDEAYTALAVVVPGKNMGPRISLEDCAAQLREGKSLDDVMIMIAEEVTRFKVPKMVTDTATINFEDFEFVRPNLTTKLIDPLESERYLSDKPWTPVGDWGLLYRIKMVAGPGTLGSAPITHEIMGFWNMSVEELHRAAVDK